MQTAVHFRKQINYKKEKTTQRLRQTRACARAEVPHASKQASKQALIRKREDVALSTLALKGEGMIIEHIINWKEVFLLLYIHWKLVRVQILSRVGHYAWPETEGLFKIGLVINCWLTE